MVSLSFGGGAQLPSRRACLVSFFSLFFFFLIVGRQVFKYTLIMTYCVFTEQKKLKRAINPHPSAPVLQVKDF